MSKKDNSKDIDRLINEGKIKGNKKNPKDKPKSNQKPPAPQSKAGKEKKDKDDK